MACIETFPEPLNAWEKLRIYEKYYGIEVCRRLGQFMNKNVLL